MRLIIDIPFISLKEVANLFVRMVLVAEVKGIVSHVLKGEEVLVVKVLSEPFAVPGIIGVFELPIDDVLLMVRIKNCSLFNVGDLSVSDFVIVVALSSVENENRINLLLSRVSIFLTNENYLIEPVTKEVNGLVG